MRLDIIGGGYERLAFLTGNGLRCLEGSSLIFYPERLEGYFLESVNPRAELRPYTGPEQNILISGEIPEGIPAASIILEDGQAGREFLEEARKLFDVEYHPTLPLWKAACRKAGLSSPDGVTVVAPGAGEEEDARETASGHRPVVYCLDPSKEAPGEDQHNLMGSGDHDLYVVGYDGRALWPCRKMPAGRISSLARHLPPYGRIFVMDAPGGGVEEKNGLTDLGVVVTRSLVDARILGEALQARGATPYYFPTISQEPPEDWGEVDGAMDNLGAYRGIILTSPRAVETFMGRLHERGYGPGNLAGTMVLAVGEKTAAALTEHGVEPDVVPERFRAEGLVEILAGMGIRGDRFLLPRAQEAREILPRRIEELGGEVTVAPLYRTVPADPDTRGLVNFHRAGMVDVLTFTSGSTFRFFLEILGLPMAEEIIGKAKLACIGPVTAGFVREAGFEADIVPGRSTVDDLVLSMERHFKSSDSEKT